MKRKSTRIGAALVASSLLNVGAQAVAAESKKAISGAGDPTTEFRFALEARQNASSPDRFFSLGPIAQMTDGVEVGDTFVFRDGGDLFDGS
ncbi:hypothetical protein [uncultured Rhodoblastus sp.]|uniref:hypothetical protein n=1 Tax=uncultured Rhodoblastus sp. TaxID=543037 RepID=UPI0025FC268E|nr:hypothetical protein [uncultured Rhodoblastus sp.]